MATETLTFRVVPVGECDANALAGLVNAAFHRYPIMEGDRTSPEDLLEEVGEGDMLVFEADGRPIACGMVQSLVQAKQDPSVAADTAYFGLAAVDAEHMGTGLGKRLVTEAEAIARERGFKRMTLGTLREFGLLPFYENLGYRTTRHEDYEAGHWGVTVPHRHYDLEKWL